MTWVAGADGFRHRWFVVLRNTATDVCVGRIVPTFAGLLALPEEPAIVGVDIPIGLPEVAMPGGRACDRQARTLLGVRRSSVFTPVGRDALRATTRRDADAASRAAGGIGIGIGAQAWGLAAKLREADAAMSAARQRIVREVHPELSFRAMNTGTPMAFAKKNADGQEERRAVLIASGFPAAFVTSMASDLKVGRDDFLDACAAAWSATRILQGEATRIPAAPDRDARGLDQAIWF